MQKRISVLLLVAVAGVGLFMIAMLLEQYVLAIAAILIPAVGALFYSLGKAELPHRQQPAATRRDDRRYTTPSTADR